MARCEVCGNDYDKSFTVLCSPFSVRKPEDQRWSLEQRTQNTELFYAAAELWMSRS